MVVPIVYICWVCGAPVSLEECKIDEHGEAVHEKCYVTMIAQHLPVLRNGPSAA